MGEITVKIVITDLQLDFFTKKPVVVTITIFDDSGTEQLRTKLSAKMFTGELSVGAELLLIPKNEIS
jgi:hypothetical protein